MNYIIEANNISKKYNYGDTETYQTLRDTLLNLFRSPVKPANSFWALKNISFKIKEGQVFGIIGPNGSGKSTLLKILSRITLPTSGQAILHGRVGSLLEVGTGFHQELTGRENIYLNGAILGMTRKEIKRKFDEIVDFSGVEKFLDTPVKRYSSGMYVRLAFAVAAHLDPEILLIDEVLAVGDSSFQKKSINKMEKIARSGRTVVFVSHNLGSIKALCHEGIYLQNGRIKHLGRIDDAISKYSSTVIETSDLSRAFEGVLKKDIRIQALTLNDKTGNLVTIEPNEDIKFTIYGKSLKNISAFRFTLSIYKDNVRLFSLHDVNNYLHPLKSGKFKVIFEIPKHFLRPGQYTLAFGGHQKGGSNYIWGENLLSFVVANIWSEVNEEINVGVINLDRYHALRTS